MEDLEERLKAMKQVKVRNAGKSLVLAGLLAVCGLVGTLTQQTFAAVPAATQRADVATIAWIDLEGSLSEKPGDLAWLMGSEDNPTLRQVIETIRKVGEGDKYSGLMIRLKDAKITSTQVEEMGAAIKDIRAKGKKVHVFSEGFGTGELMLGSYADQVLCQSGGGVMLPGMYMEEMFLADTLAWAGLKADMVQVGDYKGAAEQMGRSTPSKEWNQNIDQLLDSMYGNLRSKFKTGRGMDDAKLDAAMEKLWLAEANEAVKAGLIDKEVDLPRINELLKETYGGEVKIQKQKLGSEGSMNADAANPFAMMSMFSKKPETKAKGPTIAVLHIDGAIVDGNSTGGFGGGGNVGSRTIRNALEDILRDDNIKGVIVRVDSPGGSAIASEIIWQGVKRIAEKKPVWTSVGSMAASGGYYIAVAGEKIYVNPSSIVGSIGVVGGKISMAGLYEKLKVNVVGRGRGPMAAMFASDGVWSEADRAVVREKMTQTYTLFTKRVEAGRKGIELGKTAEGRLFTGDKAIGLKMADKMGGLEVALADMGQSLNMSKYDVMDFPGPRPFSEVLEDSLKGFGASVPGGVAGLAGGGGGGGGQGLIFSAIREVVGETVWSQIEKPMQAMMQMREGKVMLVSPRVLIIKQ